MPNDAGDGLLANLARNARSARLRPSLTIEELSERADLDVLTLEAIEGGEGRRLTLRGLEGLARALGLPAGALLLTSD